MAEPALDPCVGNTLTNSTRYRRTSRPSKLCDTLPVAAVTEEEELEKHRIYSMSVASVYPLYVAKAERKGRSKAEVNTIIRWLTGHTDATLAAELGRGTNFEDFFAAAPELNPARAKITGVVCGVRVEEIAEPTMREIRYLDKLIDELAKGKAMEKILRAG